MNLTQLICELTLPCADNGRDFTRTDRIHRIRDLLRSTPYTCLGEKPLAQVWQHPDFDPALPLVRVSSHIDSLYTNYHASCDDGILLGTFDNSVTNAVILSLILENRLPQQVLVAFTGDEEDQSRGADQASTSSRTRLPTRSIRRWSSCWISPRNLTTAIPSLSKTSSAHPRSPLQSNSASRKSGTWRNFSATSLLPAIPSSLRMASQMNHGNMMSSILTVSHSAYPAKQSPVTCTMKRGCT